jgi:PEP-CTERM motif
MAMKRRELFRLTVFLPALFLAAMLASPLARAGTLIYVAGSGNEFGTLNLSTGAFTQIDTLSLPSGDYMNGMGFGPDGKLYGVDSNTIGTSLYQIDTGSGALSNLGPLLAPNGAPLTAIDATADAAGKMYALSQGSNALFYTLNPPSLTTKVIGSTGLLSAGLMAVNAPGTRVFTSVNPGNGNSFDLYSVNPTTAASTLLGSIGYDVINGLFVNGTLYGFDKSGDIITINTKTGLGTKVARYSLPGGDWILASGVPAGQIGPVVPEPSSLVLSLLGAGTMGAFVLVRRRRETFS